MTSERDSPYKSMRYGNQNDRPSYQKQDRSATFRTSAAKNLQKVNSM